MKHTMSGIAIVLLAGQVSAAEPSTGPAIEDFGPVFDVADRDWPVDTGRRYRIAFDAVNYSPDGKGINRELETVARFMNMHAAAGVPTDNMDLVVVLHGEALKSALDLTAYRKRYGRDNPNLAMLHALAESGVRFVACGQSLGFREFDADELAAPVEVALSAMTAFATLDADGYTLMP